MELTVLGSCGAFPGAGRVASGYLVRHEGFNLVMDLGNGALSTLQTVIPYHDIDAVVVSHSHPDHCVDLYALFIARLFHPEPLPLLPLVTAPGVFDRLAGLGDPDEVGGSYDLREVDPGASFELGPFRIQTRPVPHWVPAMGLRVETNGQVLAYSGDSGPTAELEVLGRDATLMINECSWQEGDQNEREPFHLTARWAGEHAERAGAGRLMLSHFWPTHNREVSREQAASAYEGPITLAEDGLRLGVEG